MFFISGRIALIRHYINLFLFLIKWPVAFAMLLVVPAALQTFYHYYEIRNQLIWHNLIYFSIGLAFFAAVRTFFILRHGVAETMEHEMTHILFALATLHPVSRMDVHDSGGGSMTFSGDGNWLIAIAPYFFPLTAFTMMFFTIAINQIIGYTPNWVFVALGVAVCYNLFAFVEQFHPRQTDFKAAGYLFTLCFVPGANCLTFGTIVAFVERGYSGIFFFYRLILYYARQDFNVLLEYI